MARTHQRVISENVKYGLDEVDYADFEKYHQVSIAKSVEDYLIQQHGYKPEYMKANPIQKALQALEHAVKGSVDF